MLAIGHTYAQISKDLGVSLNTVESHIKNLYRKLDVHSARAAVWRALELRMLGESERFSPLPLSEAAASRDSPEG